MVVENTSGNHLLICSFSKTFMYPFKSNTYIENIENKTLGNTIINIISLF